MRQILRPRNLHLRRPVASRVSSPSAKMYSTTPLFRAKLPSEQTKEDPSQLTPVTVTVLDGQMTHYIRRSYPKAKPEKLLSGLSRLLSLDIQSSVTAQSPSRARWMLSHDNDAIHLALALTTSALQSLESQILNAATELAHEPHTALHQLSTDRVLLVVTCTTHNPYGLSLKDVKLAERIDLAVEEIGRCAPGEILTVGFSGDESGWGGLVKELVRRNEDAAKEARDNPDSACNVKGRGM